MAYGSLRPPKLTARSRRPVYEAGTRTRVFGH
jgi:hypothetical protein